MIEQADDRFERRVFIDPNRERSVTKETKVELPFSPPEGGGEVDVPLEVAAVGAKMRNLARVAGERVREMDHFVAEVRYFSSPLVTPLRAHSTQWCHVVSVERWASFAAEDAGASLLRAVYGVW